MRFVHEDVSRFRSLLQAKAARVTDPGSSQTATTGRLDASAPLFRRAVKAFEHGELEEAAGLCREMLADNPVCFDALHLFGVTKSRLRQIEDALALFDRALALQPGHPDLCNNRGTALVELGRLPEALVSYDQALAARDAFAEAHNNRGCVLMLMDRFEEALASFGKALVRAPDSADYMNNLGRALTCLHRYDDAIACFDDAIAQEPGFADAMLNRGRVLEQRGAFEDAVVAYGEAMDAGVEMVEALLRRAEALRAVGRQSEARSDYRRALRLAPDRPDVVLGLSRVEQALAASDPARDLGVVRADAAADGGTRRTGETANSAITSAIDRITVITLDRTPDKYETFVRSNPHLPIERFSGADGRSLDRWDYVDEGLITPGNPYPLGALGATISHVRLWQKCAAQGYPIHVAEDDAVFRRDFMPMASAMLATLSDWDIVLWAWNFDWPMEVVLGEGLGPAVIECNEETLRAQWASFPTSTAVPTMLRLSSNTGICAYSLSPGGAKQLLQRCLPIAGKSAVYPDKTGTWVVNRTVDIEMTRHYASLKAFVSIPCLAMSLNVKAGHIL